MTRRILSLVFVCICRKSSDSADWLFLSGERSVLDGKICRFSYVRPVFLSRTRVTSSKRNPREMETCGSLRVEVDATRRFLRTNTLIFTEIRILNSQGSLIRADGISFLAIDEKLIRKIF